MKFKLDNRENSAKKKNSGRAQIKLEVASVNAKKTAYDRGDGSDYSSDNADSDNETERVYY